MLCYRTPVMCNLKQEESLIDSGLNLPNEWSEVDMFV